MVKKSKFPKVPKIPKTTNRTTNSGSSITRRTKVGNTTYSRTDSPRGTTFTTATRGDKINTSRVTRVNTKIRKTDVGIGSFLSRLSKAFFG